MPLTQVTVVNGTTMTAVTGPHTAGGPFRLELTFAVSATATDARPARAGPSPTPLRPSRASARTAGPYSGGTPVTITGTNFPPQSANPTLTIDNVPLTQVTVVNGTTMTAVTGPHTAGGPFRLDLTFAISATATASAPGSAGPSPTPLRPSRASARTAGPYSGGTPVTITGTNFPPQSANPTLTIDNVPLTQVTVVNGTTMTGVTGPHAAGGPFDLDLQFQTGTGTEQRPGSRRAFTYAAPTLTSISPNSGSVLGGTPVTITGTNFPPQSANPTLTIDNVPLTQVTVVNGTTMTGVTGPHAAGGPFRLELAFPVGTITERARLGRAFTYVVLTPPSLTIAVNAGNNQTATVGTVVATAPSVIVHDASNNPVAGVVITFAVASGGGSVTGASQTTGANGIATVGSWTLGTTAGPNTLTATATGSGIAGNPVTFSATGTTGPATQIAVSAGNNQSAATGTAVAVASRGPA